MKHWYHPSTTNRYHRFSSQPRGFACYQRVATSKHEIIQKAALDIISRASGLVVCTAPTGFGKSILASQTQDHCTSYSQVRYLQPFEQDRIEEVLSELREGPRSLLVLDDSTNETLDWLSQTTIGEDNTVLCLGHWIDQHLVQLPDTTILGEPDLRFDLPEIQGLAQHKIGGWLDGPTAQLLVSNGWPEHVDRVVSAIAEQRHSPGTDHILASDGPHLDVLINRCLSVFSEDELQGLAQLAHLDYFSAAAANGFAPGVMETGRSIGFPFLYREHNSIELPTLIRERVRKGSAFTDDSAAVLAPLLVGTIGTPATLKTLLSVSATKQAAEIVCSVTQDQLSATDQTEMLGILRAIEDAEPDQPLITLRRAGVHRNLAQLDAEHQAILRSITSAKDLGLTEQVLSAEVALLRLELRSADLQDVERRLQELEAASAALAPTRTTSAAIRELRAMVLSQKPDLPSIYRSIELFRELASEWEFMGDRLRSGWLLRTLAAGPLHHIGNYTESRELLDRAVPLVKDSALSMAATANLLCRFLAMSGESDRLPSQLTESRRLVNDVGLTWMAGYLDWSVMLSCVYSRDADEAERAFRTALSKIGELAAGETGTVFYAEAASVFSVLGSEQLAEECLANAQKGGDNWLEVTISELIFHARCGDASRVEGLVVKALRSPNMPHERSWRVELEGVVAADRLGQPDPNREATLERIEEACRELRLTALFEALQVDVQAIERTDAPSASQEIIDISLLGNFVVRAAGEPIAIPPGHVSQLLKLLVTRGEPLSVEYVVSRLWPDADLTVGKRRLKNVTSRLNALTEAPVAVRQGDRIWLSDGVTSDLAMFREAAGTAVRPPDTGKRLSACVDALNLYSGHLLPTDLYDDDLTRERDALRAVALTVLDVAIQYAEHRTVEPAWVLQVAIRIEPDSEAPYLRIARIADATEAHECAAAANSQAESLVANLGFG